MTRYFLIPIDSVTTRMINSSTNCSCENALKNTAGTHVLLESAFEPPDSSLLDFQMYYTEQARELVQSIDW